MAVEKTSSQAPTRTGKPMQSAAITRKPHGRFLSFSTSSGLIRRHSHPMADESELCKDIPEQANHARQYNNLPWLLALCFYSVRRYLSKAAINQRPQNGAS